MNRSFALLCLILIIAAAFAGCANNNAYAAQIAAGSGYASGQEYDQAIAAYNKAVGIDQKQSGAYFGLADVYAAREDENTVQEISGILKQGYLKQTESADKAAFAQKYLNTADTLAVQGKTQWALALLQDGYNLTGFASLKDKADEITAAAASTQSAT